MVRDLDLGWSARPFTLTLTGPAGGIWVVGGDLPVDTVVADAVEAMLHLSGRGGLTLPDTSPLATARVAF